MFYLIVIAILVFWVFTSVVINFKSIKNGIVAKYTNHGTSIVPIDYSKVLSLKK